MDKKEVLRGMVVDISITLSEEAEIDHYRDVWESTDDLNGGPVPFRVVDSVVFSGSCDSTKDVRKLELIFPDACWLIDRLEDWQVRVDGKDRAFYTRFLNKIYSAFYQELRPW